MEIINALGRRKTAVARVYLSKGKGTISINKKAMAIMFPIDVLQAKINQPFVLTETVGQYDVKVNVMNYFLKSKYTNLTKYNNPKLYWYPTTNHCIKRKILNAFVDWYYPECKLIGVNDYDKYSYYHERLFNVFILENKFNIYYLKNTLIHFQNRSHENGIQNICDNNKKYFLTYNDNTGKFENDLNKLTESVKKYSDFETVFYNKTNIEPEFIEKYKTILLQNRGGGYWLWKPYIILSYLKKIKDNDLLFYLDSKYYFVENFKDLYKDKLLETDILVWKNKPNEEITYLKNWCKMDVIKKYNMEDSIFNKNIECCWAGGIIIKKNEKTIKIVEQWLEMCCNENYITDIPSITPNDSSFIEHRHDQSLLSIVLHKNNISFYYFEKKYLQNARIPW